MALSVSILSPKASVLASYIWKTWVWYWLSIHITRENRGYQIFSSDHKWWRYHLYRTGHVVLSCSHIWFIYFLVRPSRWGLRYCSSKTIQFKLDTTSGCCVLQILTEEINVRPGQRLSNVVSGNLKGEYIKYVNITVSISHKNVI